MLNENCPPSPEISYEESDLEKRPSEKMCLTDKLFLDNYNFAANMCKLWGDGFNTLYEYSNIDLHRKFGKFWNVVGQTIDVNDRGWHSSYEIETNIGKDLLLNFTPERSAKESKKARLHLGPRSGHQVGQLLNWQHGNDIIEVDKEESKDTIILALDKMVPEKKYTLEDSFRRANQSIDYLIKKYDIQSIALFGYCQGGWQTYGAVAGRAVSDHSNPEIVKHLATFGAPSDFHGEGSDLDKYKHPNIENMSRLVAQINGGYIPGTFNIAGFNVLNNFEFFVPSGFIDLFKNIDNESYCKRFIDMRAWYFNPKGMREEYFVDGAQKKLFGENSLLNGKLNYQGKPIKVENIKSDRVDITHGKKRDNITSEEQARGIIPYLVNVPEVEVHGLNQGHIGIYVSRNSTPIMKNIIHISDEILDKYV